MIEFSAWLENLFEQVPYAGTFLEKTYPFWREHILVANVTHFVLGFGVALVILTRWKKLGSLFVIAGLIVHVLAYLG